MKCARAQELFSGYAENVLEPPLRVVFEQHLAECADCKAEYEQFNATLMMLEEIPQLDPPAGFHAAVMARVEQGRQVVPHKVKWLHLDLQRVFTVRVPARALAAGFAVLLMMVLVFQLTPVGSITANVLFPGRGGSVSIGVNDPGAPVPSNHNLDECVSMASAGLSICVDTSSLGTDQNSYALKIHSEGNGPTEFRVYLMSENAVGPAEVGTPYQSGFVQGSQDATVGIQAGRFTVALMECVRDGRSYTEYVFLPSRFNSVASSRSLPGGKLTVYSALKQFSETYGVVVLASGDLGRRVGFAGGESITPEEAVFDIVKSAGLKWSGVGSSIYKVEPGR